MLPLRSPQIAMVTHLPDVLRSCPPSLRRLTVEKLYLILQSAPKSVDWPSTQSPSFFDTDDGNIACPVDAEMELLHRAFEMSLGRSMKTIAVLGDKLRRRRLKNPWRLRYACALTLPVGGCCEAAI